MVDFSLDAIILKPLFTMFLEMLKWSIQLFPNVGGEFFSLTIIQKILAFFQYLMYGMFIIGSLLALIDFIVSYIDGAHPNAMTTAKSICKGLVAALFMQKMVLLSYEAIYFLTYRFFLLQNEISDIFSQQKIADTFRFQANNQMIGLIIVLILIFLILNILFQFLERNGLFLLHQCTSIFFIISICRGYETAFSTWLKQGMVLCFMNFMQMLFFVVALVFFQQATTAFIALGLMLTAYRIEKVLTFLPMMNRITFKQYAVVQNAKEAFNRSTSLE